MHLFTIIMIKQKKIIEAVRHWIAIKYRPTPCGNFRIFSRWSIHVIYQVFLTSWDKGKKEKDPQGYDMRAYVHKISCGRYLLGYRFSSLRINTDEPKIHVNEWWAISCLLIFSFGYDILLCTLFGIAVTHFKLYLHHISLVYLCLY